MSIEANVIESLSYLVTKDREALENDGNLETIKDIEKKMYPHFYNAEKRYEGASRQMARMLSALAVNMKKGSKRLTTDNMTKLMELVLMNDCKPEVYGTVARVFEVFYRKADAFDDVEPLLAPKQRVFDILRQADGLGAEEITAIGKAMTRKIKEIPMSTDELVDLIGSSVDLINH